MLKEVVTALEWMQRKDGSGIKDAEKFIQEVRYSKINTVIHAFAFINYVLKMCMKYRLILILTDS